MINSRSLLPIVPHWHAWVPPRQVRLDPVLVRVPLLAVGALRTCLFAPSSGRFTLLRIAPIDAAFVGRSKSTLPKEGIGRVLHALLRRVPVDAPDNSAVTLVRRAVAAH